MSAQLAEIQGISIILLGDFNPKIFQPAWFAAQNLIRQQEADEANINIVHPEVVSFTLQWLALEVTRERFAVSTTQEPYYKVARDLVLGAFQLLQHTPLHKLGINADMHFRMDSEKSWHDFGDLLAPKEIWKGLLKTPGIRSFTMEGQRPDDYQGYIRVKIEPSVRIRPGVYFQVNDHYEVKTVRPGMGADEVLAIFESVWDESLSRSKSIAFSLLQRKQ